jgi:hypothetical protein
MRRFWRITLRSGIAATVVALLAVAGFAAPAGAANRSINIVSNVNIRPVPDTSQAPLALMPAGSRPQYICYVDGQNEDGTTKWFYINWNGVTGYYSSVADDVPLGDQWNIEGFYGITRCGTGADINQTPAQGTDLSVIPEEVSNEPYNRDAAVQWALNNAQAVRGNAFADCTWFVSQALWAGGLHQTSYWNSYESRQGSVLSQPGTDIARGADDLEKYLQRRFPITKEGLLAAFRTNAVPDARPGDVIVYDWDSDGIFDHLAFVVSIAPGQYPEVAEWGTVPVWEPYQKRGWTYSALHNNWLQQDYPGVTAELLHFNLPG